MMMMLMVEPNQCARADLSLLFVSFPHPHTDYGGYEGGYNRSGGPRGGGGNV